MKDKIIFLINSPYPHYTGGRETWIYEATNKLLEKYDIDIISKHQYQYDVKDGEFVNIDERIKIFPAKNLKSYKWSAKLLRSVTVYFNEIILAKNMYRIAKQRINDEQKTYIVAMDSVFTPLVWIYGKKVFKHAYKIISFRGKHLEIYASYWPIMAKQLEKIEKRNLEKTDFLWVNGYDTKEYVENKGYDCKIIYNGVDCNKIMAAVPDKNEVEKISKWHPQLFTVGSLLDLKGYPEMIQCVALLKEKYQMDVHLVSYGKGETTRYKALASELNVSENIHFMGELRGAACLAKQADIAIVLGSSEGAGMSMAALELLASGTPVIAWDNVCYQQLICNGENGVLIPEGKVEQLAEKIAQMLGEKEQYKKLGINAQQKVWDNDWSNVIRMIECALNEYAGEERKC